MTQPIVGVLVPTHPGALPPPEARPIGRAALALRERGLRVVFGDTVQDGILEGVQAVPGGWTSTRADVCGFVDRFPSQNRAGRYAKICENLAGKMLLNAPSFTALCRDKLETQRLLEGAGLVLPEVVADPAAFASTLASWGAGYLKPRFGALGVGVRRVEPGDPLPASLPGVVDGRADPALLQRAVPPPAGWAGWSVRVLAQLDPDEGWVLGHPVVRRSRADPVVNAARGAEVHPGEAVLQRDTLDAVEASTRRVITALSSQPGAIELGLDLVIDVDGAPHIIEVNSRPRGRLEVLARRHPERFGRAHLQAVARPLRLVAAWSGR